jgi:hypothetical protein
VTAAQIAARADTQCNVIDPDQSLTQCISFRHIAKLRMLQTSKSSLQPTFTICASPARIAGERRRELSQDGDGSHRRSHLVARLIVT